MVVEEDYCFIVKDLSVQWLLDVDEGPGAEGDVVRHDLLMFLEGLGVFIYLWGLRNEEKEN